MLFYQGLNLSDVINIISLICGFALNFIGVGLLTLFRMDSGGYSRTPQNLYRASVELMHTIRSGSGELRPRTEQRSPLLETGEH
jgi:hypothetical protein